MPQNNPREVYYHGPNTDDGPKLHKYEVAIFFLEFPAVWILMAVNPLLGGSLGLAAILYDVAVFDRHFSEVPLEGRIRKGIKSLTQRS